MMKNIVINKGSRKTILAVKASYVNFVLEEGAALTYILAADNGWKGSPKLEFEMAGEGSKLDFFAFIIGSGGDNFEFETRTIHSAPRTKSRQQIKSALYDHSFTGFSGNIIIEKHAGLSDAYMSHRSLLLSDEARVRTLPALEIMARDVKAGHAATTGKVDREMLFYLQSRGIDPGIAEQLLITSFFESQLAQIEGEEMRKRVRAGLTHHLNLFKYD